MDPQSKHLYIHIPYCVQKCPYCDFNSIAGRNEEFSSYIDALLIELEQYQDQRYDTIFIGGGTPSILPPDICEKFLSGVRQRIQLADNYEWTCEANPGSVDQETFAIMAAHGINRLSLGIQSRHDHHLEFLGRVHNREQAERALSLATQHFSRVSCDFICALPDQSDQEFCDDLACVDDFHLQHISVYLLMIEPGTEFHARYQRGLLPTASQERGAEMLQAARQNLSTRGLQAYETSNFARNGEACRHNLAYWQQCDYDAVGAGAVSTQDHLRRTRLKHPAQYIQSITNGDTAIKHQELLSSHDILLEAWMLGLRLEQGVALQRLQQLGDVQDRWMSAALKYQEQGLIHLDHDYLRLSTNGRPLQDMITVGLMPG
ncbi:MAG: radical SAM family heme chaperone HemW [Planctomycetes bacterium]|nr:radical SAM family heme chaperone HemW [Planctomycetota bacterium]